MTSEVANMTTIMTLGDRATTVVATGHGGVNTRSAQGTWIYPQIGTKGLRRRHARWSSLRDE